MSRVSWFAFLAFVAVLGLSGVANASVSRRNLLRHDPRRDEALLGVVTALAFGIRVIRSRVAPRRSRRSLF